MKLLKVLADNQIYMLENYGQSARAYNVKEALKEYVKEEAELKSLEYAKKSVLIKGETSGAKPRLIEL